MSARTYKEGNRYHVLSKDFYKKFAEKYPDSGLTKQEISLIIKESNKCIADYILNEQLGFKLPYNLGYIAVTKYKPAAYRNPVDWASSKKYKRRIYFANFHTFGYVYRIRWFKNPKNKTFNIYKFTSQRIIKRNLAKKIQGGADYLKLDKSYFEKKFNIINLFKDPE